MQILIMLFFLLVWLFILWVGSVALESTGLERSRARFQALSALSGTGFTTSHAEDVVDHPKRRQIVGYLIFLGNAGILSFIVILVVNVRSGLTPPSVASIVITVVVLLFIGVVIWTGLIDIVTSGITRLFSGRKSKTGVSISRELYRYGDSEIVRLKAGEQSTEPQLAQTLNNLKEKGITIIGIERGEEISSGTEEAGKLQPGDYLICLGNREQLKSAVH